jgi:hypothetical protein
MESKILDRMTLRRLLALLDDEEREIIRGYLTGMAPTEMGVPRSQVPILIHRIAVLGGVNWTCRMCGELPANQFAWSSPGLCSKHDVRAQRRATPVAGNATSHGSRYSLLAVTYGIGVE